MSELDPETTAGRKRAAEAIHSVLHEPVPAARIDPAWFAGRGRGGRAVWRRGVIGLGLTAALVAAIAFAAWPRLSGTGPAATGSGPAGVTSPSVTNTASSPIATQDPRRYANDARLKACGGLEAGIEGVVALEHAWAYRPVMPGIGFIPQLDASAAPTLLVIYQGEIPIELDWRTFVHHPPVPPTKLPSSPSPEPTTRPEPTPLPGTRHVCLAMDGFTQVVENTPVEPLHPELATLATRPATPAGQARVVTRNKASTYRLAWDGARRVLWYTVQSFDADNALYRLDPMTGETKRWGLPSSAYNGFMSDIVVDGTGAVWFSFSDKGGTLYRLDSKTERLAHHDVDLNAKPGAGATDGGGTWISAIAADGDGVLIARNSLAYLTRVDSSLHETTRITLPAAYAGASGLAVVGEDVAVGVFSNAALFTRSGRIAATMPSIPLTTSQPPRFYPAGSGEAAALGLNDLLVFDTSGAVVRRVPVTFDLPRGSFGDAGMFESNVRPEGFATDWQGTFWYTIGTYLVEVRAS